MITGSFYGVLEERDIYKRGSICASNIPGDSLSQMPRSFDKSRVTSSKAVRSKTLPHLKGRFPGLNKLSKRKKESAKKVEAVDFLIFYIHIYIICIAVFIY